MCCCRAVYLGLVLASAYAAHSMHAVESAQGAAGAWSIVCTECRALGAASAFVAVQFAICPAATTKQRQQGRWTDGYAFQDETLLLLSQRFRSCPNLLRPLRPLPPRDSDSVVWTASPLQDYRWISGAWRAFPAAATEAAVLAQVRTALFSPPDRAGSNGATAVRPLIRGDFPLAGRGALASAPSERGHQHYRSQGRPATGRLARLWAARVMSSTAPMG
jgi:hypothetical protein